MKRNCKVKPYFEGWYFKHQQGGQNITFIPSISMDENGKKQAHIQVITESASYQFHFPYAAFCRGSRFGVRIGKCIFTGRGIIIDLQDGDISIQGRFDYGPLTKPRYDIMGPFAAIPGMECVHGVISLRHTVNGTITINNEEYSMHNGNGYLESDRGSSFPKRFLWTQCGDFMGTDTAIMAAAAEIPLGGISFHGCICSILYHGEEHRLATYNGAKILDFSSNGLLLKKGPYKLQIELVSGDTCQLLAPAQGRMERTIQEKALCTVRYRFFADNTLLFSEESAAASFEYDEANMQ